MASGSFHADAGSQESTTVVSGGLAPLPFEDLRDGTDSQLRCFRGGIGQASDTYNVSCVCCSLQRLSLTLLKLLLSFVHRTRLCLPRGNRQCFSSNVADCSCHWLFSDKINCKICTFRSVACLLLLLVQMYLIDDYCVCRSTLLLVVASQPTMA